MYRVTNIQLYLAIGIPSLLVLVGIVLNQMTISSLRADMKDGLSGLGQRIAVIEADLRQFYRSIWKIEGRLDAIEKR
jgi:predicted amino acid-binding ACT domain protein